MCGVVQGGVGAVEHVAVGETLARSCDRDADGRSSRVDRGKARSQRAPESLSDARVGVGVGKQDERLLATDAVGQLEGAQRRGMRIATSRRTASPVVCPVRSQMRLKSSRSTSTTATRWGPARPRRRGRVRGVFEDGPKSWRLPS